MTADSPMVLLLLLVAAVVAVLMVLVATRRIGAGIEVSRRRRRVHRTNRSRDLR
ncbi:hypothetical protein [Brachybacterium alimentarium]|uniref:Uncharacterized protein n=1 Tax=Brachybacterium alimentarium TaxID=47845 RepID=A0A2A3YG53_9MICO|nr:hypothetical protein [Brachybacterium alimentarium]PCC34967.1 hypothetical protein CIK71_05470 [Brachybacterium alimentarium]PCC38752.1 hypothetical protein CIK66_12545 [Brachybacterium alimentarium]